MNSGKRTITVGIFIVAALIIFVVGVLTLGRQKNTFQKKISVIAVFGDVNGLQVGNNVWFSGVKIGTVSDISFTHNARVQVSMSIEEKALQYIKKDSRAKIGSEGLIGNKIVVIFDGSPQAAPIAENDVLAVDEGVNTDEMIATLQKNNQNLLDVTANIKLITEKILSGEGPAGKIISDERLANDLQAAIARFRSASGAVDKITNDVAAYTSQLQAQGALTNDLIHDTVFFSRLKATAQQIHEASIAIKQSSDNIKSISINLQNVSERLESTGSPAGVLLNDEEAGKNLKITLENLQSGTKKLDEDLEALQHNFLFRGFFKKKAKAENKE